MTTTPAPSLIPAASYARISQKVERDKVADQHRQNEAHAARTGRRIVAYYTDDGIGALGDKVRPGFERMLTDAATADWRVIIATEEERLARNVEEKLELHAACEEAGAVWDTARDGFVDPATDSGEFMSTIRAAVGRIESRRKTRRQRAASDVRAAEGVPSVGNVGYGYTRVGDAVKVVEAEAAVIREAVRRVLVGESLRGIAKDLNDRGIASPGKGKYAGRPWSTTTLKQMLLRPSLAGLRQHRGVIVGRMQGESVIDEDTRDRLVALLTDPARKTSPVNARAAKYLLSGIARCGRCGEDVDARMRRNVGRMETTKSGGTKRQPPAYVCSVCFRVRRKQEDVDGFVEEQTLRRLELADAVALFASGDPAAVREARERIEAIDAKLAILADQFAVDIITLDQLTRATTTLREERTRLDAKLTAAMPKAIPADVIGSRAREVWATLGIETRRTIIDTLMRVIIHPSGSGRTFDPDLIEIAWR